MDDVDIRICILLLVNSRATYRELADHLDLSLQAVHRRIQKLEEVGIIKGYRTQLSVAFLRPLVLYIFGESDLKEMSQAVQALSQDDRTYTILVSDRGHLSVGALLRDLGEMEQYLEFVRTAAELRNVRIGIANVMQSSAGNLVPAGEDMKMITMDYRIALALQQDSRRSAEDIAKELGISTATTRRRLQRMIDAGVLEFGIDWAPSVGSIVVFQLYVDLVPGTDKVGFGGEMLNKYSDRLLAYVTFGNQPDFVFIVAWALTLRDVNATVRGISGEHGVRKVLPNIVQEEHRLNTWRDEELRKRAVRRDNA